MKDAIVGYSGFVGSNLCLSHEFEGQYNSKNISEAYAKNPDLLVYAGVPAEMFLANQAPEKDLTVIQNACENVKKIKPAFVVLISTIAVYDKVFDVTEEHVINIDSLTPYGRNRRLLEVFVEDEYPDNHLIVRLPALYGEKLKKNFLYDLINVVPSKLKVAKFNELALRNNFISSYYVDTNDSFYSLRKDISSSEKKELKQVFSELGFTALNFTDSRSKYQFYDLAFLWKHIEKALSQNISLLNTATEPIEVSELYREVKGESFINEISDKFYNYDYKTCYAEGFGGSNGYIFNKKQVVESVKNFIKKNVQ